MGFGPRHPNGGRIWGWARRPGRALEINSVRGGVREEKKGGVRQECHAGRGLGGGAEGRRRSRRQRERGEELVYAWQCLYGGSKQSQAQPREKHGDCRDRGGEPGQGLGVTCCWGLSWPGGPPLFSCGSSHWRRAARRHSRVLLLGTKSALVAAYIDYFFFPPCIFLIPFARTLKEQFFYFFGFVWVLFWRLAKKRGEK